MGASDEEIIISGDGKTPKTAVQFRLCRLLARVARERQFINEQFGKENSDWRRESHYTSPKNHSVWVLELADGSKREVFFDTSETIYDDE